MECLNLVRAGGRIPSRSEIAPLVVLVAPFAPHLAEELWELLGHEGSIFSKSNWPSYDESKTRETSVNLAVQINGKLRATVRWPADIEEESAKELALSSENVTNYLEGATVIRVIYVPNRLINFVLEAT